MEPQDTSSVRMGFEGDPWMEKRNNSLTVMFSNPISGFVRGAVAF